MATATLPTTHITPEQFLELPDRKRFELVDGELVECPLMSIESCSIAVMIASLLNGFVLPRKLGLVLDSEATYQCFADDPNRVRRPDVSFIHKGRLPREQYEQGHCRIAPNLAVEIVSPNDVMYDLEEKIKEYLTGGVELVWLVSPKSQSVTVYRLHGKTEHFEKADVVTGETVLPEFRFQVSEIFLDPESVL